MNIVTTIINLIRFRMLDKLQLLVYEEFFYPKKIGVYFIE